MARAAEHGYQVSKPWGETARYDFAVEFEARFVRVQVKSTMFRDRGGYSCSVRGCRGPYVGDPFDFVAVYLILEDMWYIVPAEKIRGQGSIALYPRLKKSKYAAYREAWHLLRGEASGDRVEAIQACCAEWSILSSSRDRFFVWFRGRFAVEALVKRGEHSPVEEATQLGSLQIWPRLPPGNRITGHRIQGAVVHARS